MELTDLQLSVIESPTDSLIFLEGPAGSGKTTTGIDRLSYLMQTGVPGRNILLFFPQRNLGVNYQKSISRFYAHGISLPVSATFGGLARRMLSLFWPSILEHFPNLQRDLQPTFLTLESSLYFLSKITEPLMQEKGFFSTLVIQRNRLYSQILDNLNKSAVHAFPYTEIASRLIASWIGDPSQIEIYHQAQHVANLFRDYCYQHNLLDYSLQIELFTRAIDRIPLIFNYLQDQFNHLIYDNSEEDIPVAHDFIGKIIPKLESSLVIFDQDAGYRSFLGASPDSAYNLSNLSSKVIAYQTIFTSSPELQHINNRVFEEIYHQSSFVRDPLLSGKSPVSITFQPSYQEMTDWVSAKIRSLIDSGVSLGEIVVLAPYLSDSLRFLLLKSLSKYSIAATSHRPSRALRDEPATQALLTLAALAHPEWAIYPTTYEIALSLVQIITDLDLTRAILLARQAVKINPSGKVRLADFDSIPQGFQDRITFYTGKLYQELLNWLMEYASKPPLPLDHFLTHLFGEVLSRPGYGYHDDLTKGRITAQIIESVKKFRESASFVLGLDHSETGQEYYRMVKTGVLANQYIKSWTDLPDNEVFLSPAYTFLLNNKPVDYQFWLDIGSRGWYERIYQPLTNPHILHRDWPLGKPWTDDEELAGNLATLSCLTTGLFRRCRKSVFACFTETDERGFEQKGTLLLVLNKAISGARLAPSNAGSDTND